MNYRDHTFELTGSIELEIQYSYYHDPGCYSGPPERCYPEESESEILPPTDLANRLKTWADKMLPIWTKQIEDACIDLEESDMAKAWAVEAWQDYQEAKADAAYEASKEEKYL